MFDKSKLQIFSDHCVAVAESMGSTVIRTAFSAFVKETEDFTVGLATLTGETFASSRSYGATWFVGLDYRNLIDVFAYEPGDICITNDPYAGSVCTHTPDIHIWKPVYSGNELVCFAVGHIHNTDVGGAVAASLSRTLTEVHQEGIRIPPVKLFKAGKLNEETVAFMKTNVRAPEQNWGDLNALIAAVQTADRGVQKLIERFGQEDFSSGVAALLSYSEDQTRAIIRSIPDGTYSFEDYIDEDSADGLPCRLALDMCVKGDSIEMDFSRSDVQLSSSMNVPTNGHERHTLLLIAVYTAFHTLNPDVLLNTGMTRPFRCIVREGSVLNPQFPAAVGMRSLTVTRLQDVLLGCLAQALPDRMPAASSGSISLLNVRTANPRTGVQVMASLNPLVGGGGASPHGDGPNGSGGNAGFLKNAPIEISEAEVPVRILGYGLVSDSGGAGKYRGGLGTRFRFQIFSPETTVTARNRDRTRFRAWGINGGKAGKPSTFTLHPGTSRQKDLANTDVFRPEPDDILELTSSAGGGWGNPFERRAEDVYTDWKSGFVSLRCAYDEYGVAIVDGRLDWDQTAVLRREHHDTGDFFHFGPERDSYEVQIDHTTADRLVEKLFTLPVSWRFFIKHKVMNQYLAEQPRAGNGSPEVIDRIFLSVVGQYKALERIGVVSRKAVGV